VLKGNINYRRAVLLPATLATLATLATPANTATTNTTLSAAPPPVNVATPAISESITRLPATTIGLTLRFSDTENNGFTQREVRQDFIVRSIG
jgi:hypothetical protein